VRRVEREFPELLTLPAQERIALRVQAYCTLAEILLAAGDAAAALEQLRHIFSFMRADARRGPLFARILLNLDRCYRKLGTSEPPTDFVREAGECLASGPNSPPASRGGEGPVDSGDHHPLPPSSERRGIGRSHPQLDLSVIIPTYNRCAVLASCLAALKEQSLAKDRFEVIVVDDGSSDGTERLCHGLRMPVPLVYLRQTNAGAGAARKRGPSRRAASISCCSTMTRLQRRTCWRSTSACSVSTPMISAQCWATSATPAMLPSGL
jgi:tetratricopeptide (TPR) repeat protein